MSQNHPSRKEKHGFDAKSGLCPRCVHVRVIESERGSRFFLCTKAKDDPALPRYPPQPRHVCSAFAARA